MKTLNGLNGKLEGPRGIPIQFDTKSTEPSTVKDALLYMLSQARMPTPKDDVRARKLMFKLDDLKDDSMSVEDAELEAMEKAVEQNRSDFPAMVRGAVAEILEKAKEKNETA